MSYMYRSKPEILMFQPITPFHFSFTVPLSMVKPFFGAVLKDELNCEEKLCI